MDKTRTENINGVEITQEIYRFNTRWWCVDYYVNCVFDSGLRDKFHTKRECVEDWEKTVKHIISSGY